MKICGSTIITPSMSVFIIVRPNAHDPGKFLGKIADIGKAYELADLIDFEIGLQQQALCFRHAHTGQVIFVFDARFLMEKG